tara:strand:- start:1049 stop:1378 length:330 start_codon:yes stop_codon:yes gene_type:complete
MTHKVHHNQYWSIPDILYIEDEIIALLPDDATRGYVDSCMRAAENGTMKKWRLNRIVWNQMRDSCWEKFQLFPIHVMEEYKLRKEYYLKNYGENYYEDKIRNTIDWRGE